MCSGTGVNPESLYESFSSMESTKLNSSLKSEKGFLLFNVNANVVFRLAMELFSRRR